MAAQCSYAHVLAAEETPSSQTSTAVCCSCRSSAQASLDPLAGSSSPSSSSSSSSSCCLHSAVTCAEATFISIDELCRLPSAKFSDFLDHHNLKNRYCALSDEFCAPRKRLCSLLDAQDNATVGGFIGSVSSSFMDAAGYGDSQRNAKSAPIAECRTGLPSESVQYFDDVLDLLLQGVEPIAPAPMADNTPRRHGTSSAIAAVPKVETEDAIKARSLSSQDARKTEITDCRLESRNELKGPQEERLVDSPCSASSVKPAARIRSEAGAPSRSGGKQQLEIVHQKRSSWEESLGQRRRSSYADADDSNTFPGSISSPAAARSGSYRWAGPTLVDVESALAMAEPAIKASQQIGACNYNPMMLLRETSAALTSTGTGLDAAVCRAAEDDDQMCTWGRFQKRNRVEPQYTVKVRCEEDAVNDGYHWRKYGQKNIKNSPFPRSYYRCSSGQCGVKKQVERSAEGAGLLLVSYEGIHRHPRPGGAAIHYHQPPLRPRSAAIHHHQPPLHPLDHHLLAQACGPTSPTCRDAAALFTLLTNHIDTVSNPAAASRPCLNTFAPASSCLL